MTLNHALRFGFLCCALLAAPSLAPAAPADRYFPDSPSGMSEFPYHGKLSQPTGKGYTIVLLESTQQVLTSAPLSQDGGSFLLPRPAKPLHKSSGPFRLCLVRTNQRYCGSAATATPTITLHNGLKTQIGANLQ